MLDSSIFPFYLLSDNEISNMFCDLTGVINVSSKDKGGKIHDLFSIVVLTIQLCMNVCLPIPKY